MKYTKDKLVEAVKQCTSVAEVIRMLGFTGTSGSTHTHVSKLIKRYGIDTSHFVKVKPKQRIGYTPHNKLDSEDILVLITNSNRKRHSYQLKRAMLEVGIEFKCLHCNNAGQWNGKSLKLEIDHINGNPLDNRKENLRFLCPNCHSQTETYGFK